MSRPNPFTAIGQPERRQNVLLAALLVIVLIFAARLVYVQAIIAPALAQAAQSERTVTVTLDALRGDIVDSEGTVLATTMQTYTVVVNQTQVHAYRVLNEAGEEIGFGAAAAAEALAPILGASVNDLGAQLVGEDGYVILARGLSPEKWQQIAALNIPGIDSESTSERIYPNGTTAGNVLGWANAEGVGAAGLEATMDDLLTGTPGELQVEIAASGPVIPTGRQSTTPAVPGCTVHTSINSDLQWYTQSVVDTSVDRFEADWGAVVVWEVGTGRILALADSDSVDPNDPGATNPDDRGARSIQESYEPGSTGKVMTILAALEEGVVTPTTAIEDPYRLVTENGQRFTDHTEHPDQMLTTTGVLAESSNTGTVNIGSLMSDETRYDYMRRLGWGTPTGLGLPMETGGTVANYEDWDGRQRYTTMFGQGVAVNLVQNTAVFAMIANQGMAVEPSIIDGYTCNGEYEAREKPDAVQVVSPQSSSEMIAMLESVVNDGGTGTSAAIEGYRTAGKTGTAQVPDGRGGITATAASFVGIAPADHPEIAVGVIVYRPATGIFGGTVSAPIFQDVASFALQSLGVPPSTQAATPYPLTPDES